MRPTATPIFQTAIAMLSHAISPRQKLSAHFWRPASVLLSMTVEVLNAHVDRSSSGVQILHLEVYHA
jgi:hypothetical protein